MITAGIFHSLWRPPGIFGRPHDLFILAGVLLVLWAVLRFKGK